jgi:hypothetical protein
MGDGAVRPVFLRMILHRVIAISNHIRHATLDTLHAHVWTFDFRRGFTRPAA